LTFTTKSIPTYALYGEFLSGSETEALHHEPIHERSRKYGWDIQLHRHKALAQVFVFRTKGVFIRAGDIDFQTTGPAVVFVPPMITHGFQFPENIDGDVISFPSGALHNIATPCVLTKDTSTQFEAITQIISQIADAHHKLHVDRAELLEYLVHVLLLYLRSGAVTLGHKLHEQAVEMTKHEQQAHAFCTLIERNFAAHMTIDDYADALDVSAPHLTRVSNKVFGTTPNELITRRRMIEAERLLKFTRHSIADIAARAGFSDAPYFNRAFKRRHSVTPGMFRKANP
jgi:AraC family transcriptional activator of pobA